jgi:hypothetical protein
MKNTLIKTSEINIRNILQGYLNLKDLERQEIYQGFQENCQGLREPPSQGFQSLATPSSGLPA